MEIEISGGVLLQSADKGGETAHKNLNHKLTFESSVEVDDHLLPDEILEKVHSLDTKDYLTLRQFDEYLCKEFKLEESVPQFIEAVNESNPDEDEALDFLKDQAFEIEEEVDTIEDVTSIDSFDIYSAIFEYLGWEGGRVVTFQMTDDGETFTTLEIEILFEFKVELNSESLLNKLTDLSEKPIGDECEEAINSITETLKNLWFNET